MIACTVPNDCIINLGLNKVYFEYNNLCAKTTTFVTICCQYVIPFCDLIVESFNVKFRFDSISMVYNNILWHILGIILYNYCFER